MIFWCYRDFSYAGTKDKRGVTTQQMRVYRVQPETLRRVNKRLYGLQIGNYAEASGPLRLGELRGNRFTGLLVSGNNRMINCPF